MNNKILYGLIGVFVILMILALQPIWVQYVPENSFLTANSNRTDVEIPSDIQTLDFKFKNTSRDLTLQKQDSNWFVDEKLVDEAKINQLLADLQGLQFDEVVSENQQKFASYGASESGDKVTITSNDGQNLELIVGESATQQGSIYIKPVNMDKVYMVKSDLRTFLGYNKEDWRDKILVDWSEEEINQVNLFQNGTNLTLTRSDAEGQPWEIIRNQESRVMGDVSRDRFFDTFNPFEATGFASETQENIFNQRSKLIIGLDHQDETSRQFELVEDQNNSSWIVKVDNQEELFTVNAAKVQLLLDTTFKVFE